MKPDTLAALKESITHHEESLHNIEIILGPDYCALCKMFLRKNRRNKGCYNEKRAEFCPVAKKTGHDYCFKTPYYYDDDGKGGGIDLSELKEDGMEEYKSQEIKEIEFLKSLLPGPE